MKLIIAGSRTITKRRIINLCFRNFKIDINEITEIVSGTANGVDKLGEEFANIYNIEIKRFPADWDKFGKSAGYIRNKQMADYADILLSIWDGKSNGTKDMIEIMKKLNKKVYVYEIKNN